MMTSSIRQRWILLRFVICIAIVVLTSSCSTPRYSLVDGSGTTAPSATLSNMKERHMSSNVWLYEVDGTGPQDCGKKCRMGDDAFNSLWDSLFQVEIAPGRHLLTVSFLDVNGFSGQRLAFGKRTVSFDAEAGHSYVIKSELNADRSAWRPIILDVTEKTNKRLIPVNDSP